VTWCTDYCRSLYFRVMKFFRKPYWHYFAKWWIRDQRLSRIYDTLIKPQVWFSLILCLFILSRKNVYIIWSFPVIHIHVLFSAYIRDCYEIALILNLYGSPKRDIIITRAAKCSRHTVNTPFRVPLSRHTHISVWRWYRWYQYY